MKKLKSILSLVMVLIIISSIVMGLDLSVFAADNDLSQTNSTVETQAQTEAPTVEASEVELLTEQESQISTDAATQETTPTKYVGKVKKLKKDYADTDEIHVSWPAVENAEGYFVYYRNCDSSNEFKLLTVTDGTTVKVKDLTHTTPYQFKVSAFVTDNGNVYQGDYCLGSTATQPKSAGTPKLKRSSTLIQISWTKNSKATGYIIYRASGKSNGKYVKYKTIKNPSTTTYTDKSVEQGRSYYYKVKTYRKVYNNTKTYYGSTSALKTIAGLSAPGLSSATSQLRRVSLTWNKNRYAQGYDVYYSASKTGTFKLLKSTTNNFVNTPRLTNGKRYYFRVVPYRKTASGTKIKGTYLSVNKVVTDKAFGKTIGKTYIEISIKQQHMWYYINGELYVETPVVTGNVGAYSTPTGAYKIWQRSSPATLTGPTWSSYVNYWMAFTYSGCGIHDASWRSASEYGGTTYMGNGSHGCVNTPYSVVKKMYSKASIGTHVVVY